MPDLRRLFQGGAARYRSGLALSARGNAGAFAFSIVITSAYGMAYAFQARPSAGDILLFALGAVAGFALVGLASSFVTEAENEPERVQVRLVAGALSIFSVLTSVAAVRFVAWLAGGWEVWLFGPMAAVLVFLLLNGLEYALAEEGDEERAKS